LKVGAGAETKSFGSTTLRKSGCDIDFIKENRKLKIIVTGFAGDKPKKS
jgi:hypothetical protein